MSTTPETKDQEETVTITKKQYQELLDDSLILNCLRNNGVDNWEWYGEAMDEYRRVNGEDDE
jgi:hypothetical protein